MSNNVLKGDRIVKLPGAMALQSEKKVVEEYSEADEQRELNRLTRIRTEADQFYQSWAIEKETVIGQARATAEGLVEEAERRGDELINQKIEEAGAIENEAKEKTESRIMEADAQVKQMQQNLNLEVRETRERAYQEGYAEGKQKGLEDGSDDAKAIVDQLQIMLNKVIERRRDMLDELESQILHLVLQMVRKVVKALSEEHRSVVMNNVVYALRKLRKKTDVILRVNFTQSGLIQKYMQGILKLSELVDHISVVEDTTVEPGGCIVETDFGNIDARISSQLDEVERRVREMIPVQVLD